MTTVEEHRAVVASLLAPMPAEEVALQAARGRVLAADVVATTALPSFDNSAMDGYAVRAAEVADAPVTLPVAFDIPAGRTDVPPLPEGAVSTIDFCAFTSPRMGRFSVNSPRVASTVGILLSARTRRTMPVAAAISRMITVVTMKR